MKTFTIVGARPQFIKAAPVCKELTGRGHRNILVHTGQHYDENLSKVFFDELDIPAPDYNLNAGLASPTAQMAAMMGPLEELFNQEKPDLAIVYGDTNSTLAAAITALKCEVPLAHIEGGERNFTRDLRTVPPASIPEEANRVLVDHISSLIFCASKRAVDNLARENISENVHWVGDISLDIFLSTSEMLSNPIVTIEKYGLEPGGYILATIHRAINTDDPQRLSRILSGLAENEMPVILPVHPRTQKVIVREKILDRLSPKSAIKLIEPVGYHEMLALEKHARLIVTDSGGVIREAFFNGVPSIIVDETTEWIDIVQAGWSRLAGADTAEIISAIHSMKKPAVREPLLGDGNTRQKIVSIMEMWREA